MLALALLEELLLLGNFLRHCFPQGNPSSANTSQRYHNITEGRTQLFRVARGRAPVSHHCWVYVRHRAWLHKGKKRERTSPKALLAISCPICLRIFSWQKQITWSLSHPLFALLFQLSISLLMPGVWFGVFWGFVCFLIEIFIFSVPRHGKSLLYPWLLCPGLTLKLGANSSTGLILDWYKTNKEDRGIKTFSLKILLMTL